MERSTGPREGICYFLTEGFPAMFRLPATGREPALPKSESSGKGSCGRWMPTGIVRLTPATSYLGTEVSPATFPWWGGGKSSAAALGRPVRILASGFGPVAVLISSERGGKHGMAG